MTGNTRPNGDGASVLDGMPRLPLLPPDDDDDDDDDEEDLREQVADLRDTVEQIIAYINETLVPLIGRRQA